MFYREAGVFKTSYEADMALLPIPLDKYFVIAVTLFAIFVVPMIGNEYWLGSILVPVLILSIAAIGLNILTGYAGQVSLGTGAFMAAGAYLGYKFVTAFPDMNIVFSVLGGGLCAAAIGIVFGAPSLRIKGFYLAVTTLAAQFFLLWLFQKHPWFVNYSISGVPTAPPREMFGFLVTGAEASATARYLFVLGFTIVLAWVARNLVQGPDRPDLDGDPGYGYRRRTDRHPAAAHEVERLRHLVLLLRGRRVRLWAFCYINTVEPSAFDINRSFQILFMVIVGGLGSILGSFLGAAFIFTLPIFLNNFATALGLEVSTALIRHIEFMIFGGLIIFFLIVEPHGLARLWALAKEKLRMWPFPY